jgi:hypothetical protein
MSGEERVGTGTGLTSWPEVYRKIVVVHLATIHPVVTTACGSIGPSTTDSTHVTCEGCRESLGQVSR